MSLINQMLRDLQQRQEGGASPRPSSALPRRRPLPLLWGGGVVVAGLLLWGGFVWLGGDPAPDASVVTASAPAATPAPSVIARPVPPRPVAARPAAMPPRPALPAPVSLRPVVPAAAPSSRAVPPPSPAAAGEPERPAGGSAPAAGVATSPPGRLHPDLLPGSVNATSLALQQAARTAVAATPYGQAEAAYREGRRAYDAGQVEASLGALRRAITLYPGHLPARELLVDQLEMDDRAEEALALLQQGLTIAPDYTPFRKRAARLLLDRGTPTEAVGTLVGNGLPRVDADPELHRMLAALYRQLGENFLAAQTYRNLLVHDPQEGACWLALGDVLAADGQPGEARRAYQRALAAERLSREARALALARLAEP